ncbi:hypothetical protein FKV25_12710 [Lysobacter aestuarii]|uniref:Uncharacterized protein n=2 Tax=Marilutibacter aestuarii TaxID=1706195 RepID=A0A508A729_9GAMM|nr:hypothetical protein FKV25_12710 [Lysobacter aestuarii]
MNVFRGTGALPLVLLGSLVVASCSSSSPDDAPPLASAAGLGANHVDESSPAEEEASKPDMRIGGKYGDVQNTRALLSRLSEPDREAVLEFYGKFGSEAFEFETPEQLAWLIDHGYPMPEDIVEALGMTDLELSQAFEAGDVKAGFFYMDRLTEQRLRAKDANGALRPAERMEMAGLVEDLVLTGSPFAGYVNARYQSAVEGDFNAAMASYAWAAWLGDGRAGDVMMRLENRLGGTGAHLSSTASTFELMGLFIDVRTSNPELLQRRQGDAFPLPAAPPGNR